MKYPPHNCLYVGTKTINKLLTKNLKESNLLTMLNRSACNDLGEQVYRSGKFELRNITQPELDACKYGEPYDQHLVDIFLKDGLQTYSAHVYVFTEDELRQYVESVVKEEMCKQGGT